MGKFVLGVFTGLCLAAWAQASKEGIEERIKKANEKVKEPEENKNNGE